MRVFLARDSQNSSAYSPFMRRHLQSGFGMVVIVFAAGCQKAPESSPALPPPAASAPVAANTPLPASGATAAPAASSAAPAPSEYPICGGQKLAVAPSARGGAVNAQLAPAFLDQMSACRGEDAPPA